MKVSGINYQYGHFNKYLLLQQLEAILFVEHLKHRQFRSTCKLLPRVQVFAVKHQLCLLVDQRNRLFPRVHLNGLDTRHLGY